MSEHLQQLIDRLKEPRIYRVVAILGFLAVGIFYFIDYIVVAALVAGVALVAWIMNRLRLKQIGVELSTLSTVLVGVAYGPLIGAAAGLALILLQVVAGQYTGGYIIWVIPSYAIAGSIAGIADLEIFMLGAGLTIGMQTVFASLTAASSAGNLSRYMPYAVTNVLFNLAMFYYVAPVLLEFMV